MVSLICSNCFQIIQCQSKEFMICTNGDHITWNKVKIGSHFAWFWQCMKVLHFFHHYKGKNRIWINLSWIMEKFKAKLKRLDYWALDPKWTCNNISLATEQSHDVPNNLFLLTTKISRYLYENFIEEANQVEGPFFCWHPVHFAQHCIIGVCWEDKT